MLSRRSSHANLRSSRQASYQRRLQERGEQEGGPSSTTVERVLEVADQDGLRGESGRSSVQHSVTTPEGAQRTRGWGGKLREPRAGLHFACVVPWETHHANMWLLQESIDPLCAVSTWRSKRPGVVEGRESVPVQPAPEHSQEDPGRHRVELRSHSRAVQVASESQIPVSASDHGIERIGSPVPEGMHRSEGGEASTHNIRGMLSAPVMFGAVRGAARVPVELPFVC